MASFAFRIGPPQNGSPRPAPFAIFPPAPGTLELSFRPPSFQALTADTLGNAASDSDGFDGQLNDVALALASDAASVPSLDGDLSAAGFQPGIFSGAELGPVAWYIGGATDSGEEVVNKLTGAIGDGTKAIPTPTPPSVPPTVGGGGQDFNQHVKRIYPYDPTAGDIITVDIWPEGGGPCDGLTPLPECGARG